MKRAIDINELIDWEAGQLNADHEARMFQYLVDTGLVWRLQGAYGRRAEALLAEGTIITPADREALQDVAIEREIALL